MSILKTVYDELKIRIAAKAPGVAHYGLYNNQETEPGNEGAYLFPAVFVRFGYADQEENLSEVSRGAMQLYLHIQFSESYQGDAPAFVFKLLDEIHAAVQGWSIECAGPFRRTAIEQDIDHSNFQQWVVVYSGYAVDDAVARGIYDDETQLISIRLATEIGRPDGISDPPVEFVTTMVN